MNKNQLINRDIFSALHRHLSKREITMIVGPRQCGKTTVMKLLVKQLEADYKKTFFLNLDIELDNQYLETQEKFINKIKLELGTSGGFVFIDEIQRKENAGIFLKGLYDMDLPYKFVVSGSGNVEIKEKISESLMGRKQLFDMTPITFDEFVNFKTRYKYKDGLDDFYDIEKEKVDNLLMEYLNFGGYPKVTTNELLADKKDGINEVYRSYIGQDIVKWLKVEKIEAFEKLLKICAAKIGNLTEYSTLANDVNVSTETVQNYVWYLRKTFILRKCSPYFKNKKTEIIKSPIFYFNDIGLRNNAVGKFGNITTLSCDAGFIFENLVFNMLHEIKQSLFFDIYFWRTKSQAEVDFVLDFGEEVIPVEVKFKSFEKPKVERSLRSFITKYNPKIAYVVSKDFSGQILIENTKVFFVPFWNLKEHLIKLSTNPTT